MLGKTEGSNRRGQQRMKWLDNLTDSTGMNLIKLREIGRTGKPDMLQSIGSQRVGTTERLNNINNIGLKGNERGQEEERMS